MAAPNVMDVVAVTLKRFDNAAGLYCRELAYATWTLTGSVTAGLLGGAGNPALSRPSR